MNDKAFHEAVETEVQRRIKLVVAEHAKELIATRQSHENKLAEDRKVIAGDVKKEREACLRIVKGIAEFLSTKHGDTSMLALVLRLAQLKILERG